MENSFAVVTGASTGIGLELAKQFGQNGHDLLIVSGSDEIFQAQRTLEEMRIEVEAIKANLATHAGVENLYKQIQDNGRPVDVLAINAGVGVGGEFCQTDLKEEINMINLNIVSAVHLSKKVLPDMKARGNGKVLYVSSIASQMPTTFSAVYGGTKAFLTTFAIAVRNELKDSGVTITVLMPDDTKAVDMKESNDPAEVARQGYEALMEGKESVFAENLLTKIQGYAMKFIPERAKAQFHRKLAEPGSAKH